LAATRPADAGDPTFVTRFAPSPTGLAHRGHAFSALTAFQAARDAGGEFLLRLEDIDTVRCRPAFEAALLADLAWLGLTWPTPVWRQSPRMAAYEEAIEKLKRLGVLYRCFRTRRDILDDIARAPHGAAPSPPRSARPTDAEERQWLAEARPYAWRLSLDAAAEVLDGFAGLLFEETGSGPGGERGLIMPRPELGGDVILARKDLGVSYHLAVVVDDAAQGVTHVIRGEDLFAATHTQRVIQALLGLPTPTYRHHRLLLRPDGKRFAKRDTSETLADLRARGVTAEALRAELGF
jgi:glutamyl-Q tRNA(Asp) synthetase